MTQALQVTMSHSLANPDIGALATTSQTMHRKMAPLAEQRRVQAERVQSLGKDDPPPRKSYVAGRKTEKFIRLDDNGGISWGHTEVRLDGNPADYWDHKEMPHADFRVVHSLSAEHVDQMRRAILWGNRPYTPTELIKEISRMATVDPNNYSCFSIVRALQISGIPFSTSEERVPQR
ncbi:MAG: hypothetical protein Q8R63_02485 [Ramlibacter sp.]|nr:hypothetical protein [Ramlibacter sp.]